MNETSFQVTTLISTLAFFAIRAYYRRKTGTLRLDVPSSRESKFIGMFLPIWGIVWLVMLIWLINPGWMSWSAYALPKWVRWSGAGTVVIALTLLIWAHQTLSTSFSGTLEIYQQHQLVIKGPHHRIRHPMYLAIFLWAAGLALITANWFTTLFPLAFALFFLFRIPNEENMMLEAFGNEYRDYMRKTGRIIPPIHLLLGTEK